MPPPIRHTSGTLCGPPTCAHTNTHTMGHSVPPPDFPSLPFSLFLVPPLPSPRAWAWNTGCRSQAWEAGSPGRLAPLLDTLHAHPMPARPSPA